LTFLLLFVLNSISRSLKNGIILLVLSVHPLPSRERKLEDRDFSGYINGFNDGYRASKMEI